MDHCPICDMEVSQMEGHMHSEPGPTERASDSQDFGTGLKPGSECPTTHQRSTYER